jgi:hypothetical protein
MKKIVIFTLVLVCCLYASGQQSLNNAAVIKLANSGLSDDLIVTTINASAGAYDTSVDGMIALRNAGVSNKVVSALVMKASAAPPPPTEQTAATQTMSGVPPAGAQSFISGSVPATPTGNKPRVFLQSKSSGNQWAAARDQSMEMSKDFEKDCPDVRLSLNQQAADYTVALNHIEAGFSRDNQIQIANRDGDLISKTKEGGSIRGGVKKACDLILNDWAKK